MRMTLSALRVCWNLRLPCSGRFALGRLGLIRVSDHVFISNPIYRIGNLPGSRWVSLRLLQLWIQRSISTACDGRLFLEVFKGWWNSGVGEVLGVIAAANDF